MATPNKQGSTDSETAGQDLELLRNEHQQLSATIVRLSSLRLVFLFLFVFTFASALKKMQSLDSTEIIGSSNQLTSTIETLYGHSIDFKASLFVSGYCPNNVGEFAFDQDSKDAISLNLSPADNEKVELMIRNVCNLYANAFSVPMEILGIKLQLDLRHWAYGLPILYWLSAVYLYLLRKKLKVIDVLARHRIHNAQPGTIATLDTLLFGADERRSSTMYSRLPADFLKPFYSLLVFAFFVYLAICFAPFVSLIGDETNDLWTVGHGILILVTMTIVYAKYVSESLEGQVRKAVGSIPPDEIQSRWMRVRRGLRSWWRGRRISVSWSSFPKACVLSSCLLILITLGLATTMNSCGRCYKGYELAMGKAPWVDAELLADPDGLSYNIDRALGMGAYWTSLLLSVASLGLLVLSIRRFELLSNRRLMGGAFIVAAGIASFLISQLAFVVTTGPDYPGGALLAWIWVLFWIAGSFMWCRFAIVAIHEGKLRWPSNSFLQLLYVPQGTVLFTIGVALFALLYVPWGLLAYLVGIHGLALGYALQLIRACQPNAQYRAT